MKRPKVKNKEDLIKKYNKVARKYRNRGISGPESLAQLSYREFWIYIAAKTLVYGRNLKDSFINADLHLKNLAKRKEAEKLFGLKDPEGSI